MRFKDIIEYVIACIGLGVISLLIFMLAAGDFNPYLQGIFNFITSVFKTNPYLFVFCMGVGLGVILTYSDYKRFYKSTNNYIFSDDDLEKHD